MDHWQGSNLTFAMNLPHAWWSLKFFEEARRRAACPDHDFENTDVLICIMPWSWSMILIPYHSLLLHLTRTAKAFCSAGFQLQGKVRSQFSANKRVKHTAIWLPELLKTLGVHCLSWGFHSAPLGCSCLLSLHRQTFLCASISPHLAVLLPLTSWIRTQ